MPITTPPARWSRGPLLVAAFLALMTVPSFAQYYTDWLWFGELGYQQIFTVRLMTQAVLGIVAFVVAFLFLQVNFRLALRGLRVPVVVVRIPGEAPQPLVLEEKQLRFVATAVAALAALLMAVAASAQWLTWLSYRHATPFGATDPILGYDVSFYVFQLPLFDVIRTFLVVLIGLSLAGALVIYVVAGAVELLTRGLVVSGLARRHLSLLASALLLALALGAWLDRPHLLTSAAGIIHGASNVDVEARIPALTALTVAALAGAALAAYNAFASRLWPIFAAILLYGAVAVAGSAYAAFLQRFVVTPNEQAKETPYILHNIAATRKAFALENVEDRELSGDAALTRGDIARNNATLENVRLWDHQPLLDTFGQIQEIRTYYDFVAVDNDRYTIDGEYRQIMLSARELNAASLPNPSWVVERLNFTHGYGVALGPVNEVTQEGLPVLFIKNLPPESTVDLKVEEPSLYFGELSSDYVFVKTSEQEFHYPRGEDNVYSTYAGTGGVPVGGFFRKILFSLRFRSFNILLTDNITSESRVLFRRRIGERTGTIAPFLLYDDDPYVVVSEGRLYWIQDAYTATGSYPYATPVARGINYIRNSVKVVVDAYNGTTTYYLADERDPLAATLGRIFPALLRPIAEMPADLRRHVRYPEGIFAMQTAMYATYHMTNPAVFYNKEDQWEIPAIDAEGKPATMEPYYTIMRLPGEPSAEFIQMLPFTPRRKDNLAAWMVARSDGEQYGRLLVFRFPKQKVVFGPRQIVARINQDQVISPQITLWNQQGSQVIQGTLLVIPIEESLLYIRPLYLRASGGRIPELKRVIVAHQDQIVMAETLDAALERLFGPAGRPAPAPVVTEASEGEPVDVPAAPPAAAPEGGGTVDALAARARDHYARAMQAQREGDWARYGEEIRRLGEVLEQLAARRQP